jgi:hypothetical protein
VNSRTAPPSRLDLARGPANELPGRKNRILGGHKPRQVLPVPGKLRGPEISQPKSKLACEFSARLMRVGHNLRTRRRASGAFHAQLATFRRKIEVAAPVLLGRTVIL